MTERPLVEIDVRVDADALDERPLDVLSAFASGFDALDKKMQEFVHVARSKGASWSDVGAALGMTKQSAWKRFG